MFIVAFGLGAGAIALWVDYKVGDGRPTNLRFAMLHVALAMLLARFVVPAALEAVGGTTTALGAIFAVGLPACVYCLLATFWVMRQVGDMMNGARGGPGSGIKA
jgi:hypothetical protein